MSNYLFVDVETTGLPERSWEDGDEDPKWTNFKAFEKCRMVQISMIICTQNFKNRKQKSYIIKPDGFSIPQESVKFHGITTNRANEEGVPISVAMTRFRKYISKCSTFFAHRVTFDFNVIMSELHKIRDSETKAILQSKRLYCTVINTCDIVQLPGRYGDFNYPSLSDLFYYVFGKSIKHAHDARYDTYNLYMCIKRLCRTGELNNLGTKTSDVSPKTNKVFTRNITKSIDNKIYTACVNDNLGEFNRLIQQIDFKQISNKYFLMSCGTDGDRIFRFLLNGRHKFDIDIHRNNETPLIETLQTEYGNNDKLKELLNVEYEVDITAQNHKALRSAIGWYNYKFEFFNLEAVKLILSEYKKRNLQPEIDLSSIKGLDEKWCEKHKRKVQELFNRYKVE